MSSANAIDALNRLYAVHNYSLPAYLRFASPSLRQGNEGAVEVLKHISADQQRTTERIGELILELRGAIEGGEFPMEFTGLHDLSLDYLIGQMIQRQRIDIAAIESCVEQLQTFPLAKALAEEALGEARGHLDSLEELQSQPASS